jgi:hypothetical protein
MGVSNNTCLCRAVPKLRNDPGRHKLQSLLHLQALCKQKVKAKAELKLPSGALKMYSRHRKGHLARIGMHRDSKNLRKFTVSH